MFDSGRPRRLSHTISRRIHGAQCARSTRRNRPRPPARRRGRRLFVWVRPVEPTEGFWSRAVEVTFEASCVAEKLLATLVLSCTTKRTTMTKTGLRNLTAATRADRQRCASTSTACGGAGDRASGTILSLWLSATSEKPSLQRVPRAVKKVIHFRKIRFWALRRCRHSGWRRTSEKMYTCRGHSPFDPAFYAVASQHEGSE